MKKMTSQPHFNADLLFAPPFSSGEPPINFSFRAELDLGVSGMKNMVYIELTPSSKPDAAVASKIWLLYPEFQAKRLHQGKEFGVYSGAQLLANGEITEVVDINLRA
ncbi:MAG: hypothetical protein EOP50_00805 [Sphingobacteriales bacterium]|nr:MAG: hypothetical protein EOP50_00805 [Sphingobacteriales bacterium]